MGCVKGFAKFYVFLVNVVLLLTSILSYVGLLVQLQRGVKMEAIPATIGIVLCCSIIAIFGLCGAIMESRVLLTLNICGMLFLAAIKVYAIVKLYVVRDNEITKLLERVVTYVIEHDLDTIHRLEYFFKCCGATGPQFYQGALPQTCCDPTSLCDKYVAYQNGCANTLASYFASPLRLAGQVLIAITVGEIIAVIAAIYICYAALNELKQPNCKAKRPLLKT